MSDKDIYQTAICIGRKAYRADTVITFTNDANRIIFNAWALDNPDLSIIATGNKYKITSEQAICEIEGAIVAVEEMNKRGRQ